MTPSCPHGVTGPDALVEAVTAALRASDDTYIMHGKAPAIAACAIAAVRAYDAAHVAAPVAVPAGSVGGQDLAADVCAANEAWLVSAETEPLSLHAYIAAELTRLGWTCAWPGPGDGAGQGVPDLSTTLAACGWPAGVPFKLWDDGDPHGSVYLIHPDKGMTGFGACMGDMDEQRVWFIVAACNAHLERLAAPVAPACGISEGARETLRKALSWYVPNMGDAPEGVTAEIEAEVAAARAELDGLPPSDTRVPTNPDPDSPDPYDPV